MKAFRQLLNTSLVDVQREGLALLYNYLAMPSTPIHLFLDSLDNLLTVLPFILSSNKSVCLNCYHVIKLFIAQPHMSPSVHEFIYMNRQKLIVILATISYDGDFFMLN